MQRITRVEPGYDCRTVCKHERKGEHGICSDVWFFVITDGRRAVSLSVFSADYPATVERPLPECLDKSSGVGLCWHEATHAEDSEGRECDVLPAGRCKGDTTYLGARDFWREHGDPRQLAQAEEFWIALEAKL